MSYLNIFIKYLQKYLLKIAFLFDQGIVMLIKPNYLHFNRSVFIKEHPLFVSWQTVTYNYFDKASRTSPRHVWILYCIPVGTFLFLLFTQVQQNTASHVFFKCKIISGQT